MEDFMQELEKVFNEVKDQEAVYESLPDGEYLATLSKVEAKDSKKGLPMVVMTFNITHGDYTGREHRKFMMLTGKDFDQTKQNIHRYSTEIKKYGVDTSRGLEATFNQFDSIVGTNVKLTVSTIIAKKDGKAYTNTSVEVIG